MQLETPHDWLTDEAPDEIELVDNETGETIVYDRRGGDE